MDVIDLTRQVQELTARVQLLSRQRDDAREGRDSLQRELEALRLRLDSVSAENGILRSATDAAVDGVRAMLPAALQLAGRDVLTAAVTETRVLESMLRGAGRSDAADGAHIAGLSPSVLIASLAQRRVASAPVRVGDALVERPDGTVAPALERDA